jgi:Holliday junction resolvasome RuvABC endonuclease subunit
VVGLFYTTMFIAPPNQNTLTLLAIDPGLNNTGVAVFKLKLDPFEIISIDALTLQARRLIDTSGLDDEDYVERIHKRYSMTRALRKIILRENPSVVACESPFFDRRKPSSFAVLTEVLISYFDAAVEVNPAVRFSYVEPLLVKKILGVAGQKGKEVVRESMEKQDFVSKVIQRLDDLDEHAIDAICVGITYIKVKSGFV